MDDKLCGAGKPWRQALNSTTKPPVEPYRTLQFRGCRLAYRVRGCGPPVLMIHGVAVYGLSRENPQLEILERNYSVLSFDNRGSGESQPAGIALTIEQMAEDALALMNDAGWESAHVIGHSLGGMVALKLALMAKVRVRSLALLCTFARGTRITPRLLWIGLRLRFGPRAVRQRAFVELVLSTDQRNGDFDDLVRRMSAVMGHDMAELPPVFREQLSAIRREDLTPDLWRLAGIPTLVVNGGEDLVAPPSAGRELAAGIAGARYVEIPGAAHALPVLQVAECAELLKEHLAMAEHLRTVFR